MAHSLQGDRSASGYIAQWLERLTADQQVPGSNPGVPSSLCLLPYGLNFRAQLQSPCFASKDRKEETKGLRAPVAEALLMPFLPPCHLGKGSINQLGPSLSPLCLTRAVIAQLAARRSHNPKVVSSILTHRISPCQYLPEWQAGEQGCRMVMGGEWESERKREVDGEMMRLVGWAGVLGLGRFAGGALPPPLPLPFPKLRSCCSAETAYEQQLGNLGKGRGRGGGGE